MKYTGMKLDFSKLSNTYEQQAIKNRKLILNIIKILAVIFVAPILTYLSMSFVCADFNITEWTRDDRVSAAWICVVI